MRIYLKMYSSIISLIGIGLMILSLFFCFFNAGSTSFFGDDASLFSLMFGLNNEEQLIGLLFAFILLLLGIVSNFVSFLFSKLGKEGIKNSSLFAVIGVSLTFISSILFFLTPVYTSFYSISFGPFVVGGLLIFSNLFQIPNILYKKL